MRILLYGSAYQSELVERALARAGHEVVGHIPCRAPAFPGIMHSPVVSEDTPHDIRLSILYDRLIKKIDNGYNLHPGLLPRWAGCDILYHTIHERARLQGITFHKLDKNFDSGKIIDTLTYPVFPRDRIVDLYERLCLLMPLFAVTCVGRLRGGDDNFPYYYKRGLIMDKALYYHGGDDIRSYIRRQRAFQSR
jgi:hypothetical protein